MTRTIWLASYPKSGNTWFRMRPRVYEELARGSKDDEYDAQADEPPVRFVKAHDAYTLTPKGEPLLAGRHGADGAIVIVRDPRDVAPSLANHNGTSGCAVNTFVRNHILPFALVWRMRK